MNEIKVFGLDDVKFSDSEPGVFYGYANTKDIDLVDDLVEPKAFTKTTQENPERALYYMHNIRDLNNLLGKATELRPDKIGLRVKNVLNMATTAGQTAWEHVKDGTIGAMSIGYSVINSVEKMINGRLIRVITELKLREVSLLPKYMAANPKALIDGAKSLENAGAVNVYSFIKENRNDLEFVNKIKSLVADTEPGKTTPDVNEPIEQVETIDLKAHLRRIKKTLGGE